MFQRSRKTYDEAALYDYAVGALARRMRTVAELKRLLRQRITHNENENGEAMIDAVITRLKDQKYLNDSHYAAVYSSYRQSNEKFGRMRVVTDLKAKGVHGEVIEKAVTAAYSGVNEEKLAREYLARKRMRKPASQKETARIFRALARAGFGSRVIFAILKKWDVDEETHTLLSGELP
jgi:regulatory protein